MQPLQDRQQVRRVLLITLVLNLTVAAAKITIGLITGALAITADGFHSLIDGTSNIIGLIANRIAMQPPDEDHPYGHRRFETLAALLIGAFLALVAWEILRGAIARIRQDSVIDLTPLAFTVMIATLIANIAISTYQIGEGKRLNSELLLADAANTRTDVFVTLSVLVSMALVELFGWAWVDVVAALVVVALIGRAAWRILWDTGRVLVDTAPYSADALQTLVQDVPGVQQVVRARSRGSADDAYIDIDVQVDAYMTTAQTDAITGAIRERLQDEFQAVSEVEVHFSPQQDTHNNYVLVVRAAADKRGLAAHEVTVISAHNRRILDMHVEVRPEQTLDAAHREVTLLESDLLAQLPEIAEIITHIEPLLPQDADDTRLNAEERAALKQSALELLRERFPAANWHHLQLYDHAGRVFLSMHAALSPGLTVEAAHALAEQAEMVVRTALPQLARVTIHTEPYDHA